MEHLLRLSGMFGPFNEPGVRLQSLTIPAGLLGEDENGATDLGELERKLTEKTRQASTAATASNPTSPSLGTAAAENTSTPQSALTSPEPTKESHKDDKRKSITPAEDSQGEEEVEALSEMICSLVTNQCGETRYIGEPKSIAGLCTNLG